MSIRPQPLRIIHCLSSSPEMVVSKESLMSISMSGSEGSFRVNMSEARSALNQMGVKNPITQVRGAGYLMTTAKAEEVRKAMAGPHPKGKRKQSASAKTTNKGNFSQEQHRDSDNPKLKPRVFSWEKETEEGA